MCLLMKQHEFLLEKKIHAIKKLIANCKPKKKMVESDFVSFVYHASDKKNVLQKHAIQKCIFELKKVFFFCLYL